VRACGRGDKFNVCQDDVERDLKQVVTGDYGDAYLKRERGRLRWHPDRFSARGDVHVELFPKIQRLIEGPRMLRRA